MNQGEKIKNARLRAGMTQEELRDRSRMIGSAKLQTISALMKRQRGMFPSFSRCQIEKTS